MSEAATGSGREERVTAHKGWLVTQGDALGERAKGIGDFQSQFRILLEAARHETEPDVVLNLLRYQAARNDKKWFKNQLFDETQRQLEECKKKAGGDGTLAVLLMQQLLLYALRAYTYHAALAKRKKKSGGGGHG